jgi:hypothetical protein
MNSTQYSMNDFAELQNDVSLKYAEHKENVIRHIIEVMEDRQSLGELDAVNFRFELVSYYPNLIEKVYYHGCHMGNISMKAGEESSISTVLLIEFTPANEPFQAP